MAKFVYRMQNILNIKQKLETQAQMAYSIANQRYLDEQKVLQQYLIRRVGYEKQLKEAVQGNLDLQEGEDCIGKRCEQSGKRKLIGFRVIHNVASSGVFKHLPVLPCIIGQSWHYRNYQFIFILYDQMA